MEIVFSLLTVAGMRTITHTHHLPIACCAPAHARLRLIHSSLYFDMLQELSMCNTNKLTVHLCVYVCISEWTRVGFGGDSEPRRTCLSIIGRTRHAGVCDSPSPSSLLSHILTPLLLLYHAVVVSPRFLSSSCQSHIFCLILHFLVLISHFFALGNVRVCWICTCG